MEITKEQFEQGRLRAFGTENPERMRVPFWEWMVRGTGVGLKRSRRGGEYYSGYGAWHARQTFDVADDDRSGGPIWCFDRMGQSITHLADGRAVLVGGEHEDGYDPDFCIYNDVVVLHPSGEFALYGYPRELFPPTDFHTATIVGDRIYVVGGLRYGDERWSGLTTVYALDTADFHVEAVATSGEMPGWIFNHTAELDADANAIVVSGGERIVDRGDSQQCDENLDAYALDLSTLVWRRVTERGWRQFAIQREDRSFFVLEWQPRVRSLYPTSVEHEVVVDSEYGDGQIAVRGVPVSYKLGVSQIRIVVEGELPEELCRRIAEEARANAEAAIGCPCRLAE